MPAFLKQYLLSQEIIGRDALMLYRNFWHWNISKVIILGACLLAATLLSIPLIAILWWLVTSLVGTLDPEVVTRLLSSGILDPAAFAVIMNNGWSLAGVLLASVAILVIFMIFLSYGYVLLLRVYESYLVGTKLPLRSNSYWKPKYIIKFAAVFAWTSLYVLIPGVVAVLYFFGLFTLQQSGVIDVTNDFQKQVLGALAVTGLLAVFIAFIYIMVRIMMANMFFLSWTPATPATGRSFVTSSWNLTKGSVGYIIFLLVPAIIVTSMMTYVIERVKLERDVYSLVERTNKELGSTGSKYKNDHEYVNLVLAPATNLTEESGVSRDRIASQFTPSVATADREYIRAMYPYILDAGSMDSKSDTAWMVGVTVLSFFVIEGLMLMVYFSVFHILQAGRTITSPERKEKVSKELTKKSGPITPAKKVITKEEKTAPTTVKKLVPKTTPSKKVSKVVSPTKKIPKKTPTKK